MYAYFSKFANQKLRHQATHEVFSWEMAINDLWECNMQQGGQRAGHRSPEHAIRWTTQCTGHRSPEACIRVLSYSNCQRSTQYQHLNFTYGHKPEEDYK